MNTWMDTREKVFAYIREHHMLQAGDRVVAGVSGGADSVCLLFLLLEWQKEVPTDIAVVHVDHGIRTEAGEDARYVEQLCEERGIPFFLTRAEVRNRARMEKISEEEAGRRTRYEAFEKAAKEWGATKIAVAHNSNDRSETQLFHLFRGSGIRGLASILPVRDRIIRPLLCLERWEIEKFLQQRGIVYCKDATNEEDDYTRNRIRHHILPYAEQNIVKGCVAHMNQTAELLAETEDYLELQTKEAAGRCIRATDGDGESAETGDSRNAVICIAVESFLSLHPVIRKRLLYEEVKQLSPGQKDITYQHIQELQTVGQDYTALGQTVDAISPMVYPSHYANGVFGLKVPDAHPYETVSAAMQGSAEELQEIPEAERAVVRPWLQAFTATWVPGHISYNGTQIREQIQAVYDAGYEEWILWNATNRYSPDGLLAAGEEKQ